MAAFGIGVLVQVAVKIARGLPPTVEVMGAVGTLALAANLLCLVLLWRRHQTLRAGSWYSSVQYARPSI